MRGWKLPRLSRGWRIARNLLLVVLILLYLWVWTGRPIRDVRLDFRRAERENFIGPCEIQGVFDTYQESWVVAVSGDRVVLWQKSFGELNYWPRRTGEITLVPVPAELRYAFRGEAGVAAVDVPPEARSARLELTVSCWYVQTGTNGWHYASSPERLKDQGANGPARYWEKTYQAEGEFLKDGGVLFRPAAEGPRDSQGEGHTLEFNTFAEIGEWNCYRYGRGAVYRMEAVFYDGNGGELGRAVLATPEGGETDGP